MTFKHYLSRVGVNGGLLMLTVVLTGCQAQPQMGQVSGTALFRGTPITNGQVEFQIPDQGLSYCGPLDEAGHFKFDDPLPVGEYKVCVSPKWDSPEAPRQRGSGIKIPAKAKSIKTSGLTATVVDGPNEIPIEVKE